MSSRWRPLIAIALATIACAPSGGAGATRVARPSTTAFVPGAPATSVTPSAAGNGEPSSASTLHGDTLTSGASISYDGLRVWADQSLGVAIVRVIDVGPIRWNSGSGDRPDETALHSAPRGHRDSYNLGRLITVERVRLVVGRWPTGGSTAAYWRPGGSLGPDSFEPALASAKLSIGDEAVALLTDADAGADANIPVQVGWLFPVDASGRVITLDPDEGINLDNLESFVR